MHPQTQRFALIVAVIVAILLVVIAVLARNLMLAQAALASPTATAVVRETVTANEADVATPVAASTATGLPDTPQVIVVTATPLPPSETPLPTLTPTNTPTPTSLPVPSWSEASKLTTLEYLNTVMIELTRTKEGLQSYVPGEDRIIIEVVGKIQAGIALDKLPVSKIEIDGQRIKIVVPRAQILSVELLPQESRIYEADRTWIYSSYEGLEKEAFEEALRRLRENSPNNQKMLEMAETLARLQLIELLRNLGYQEVIVEFE